MLDQRKLPHETVWETYTDADAVARAIRDMAVRGAPAIGASAAYGVALAGLRCADQPFAVARKQVNRAIDVLSHSRPTAVNLRWAMERMQHVSAEATNAAELAQHLVAEADRIAEEDITTNLAISNHGADLFNRSVQLLTHCNTGSLATVEYGTALGVIRVLHSRGHLKHVWVDETRPYFQGARLTTYELRQEGIPHTLITDSMAGYFMQAGQVDAIVVGADRITRNGDTANKIGTYGLAVLAHHHGIPFYVAAPMSTFDGSIVTGRDIPIEQRSSEEVLVVAGVRVAPNDTIAAHPAFDVTPHDLITGIITEHGVIHAPDEPCVSDWLQSHGGDRT